MTSTRVFRIFLPAASLAATLLLPPIASRAQQGYPQDGAYGQQNGYPQQQTGYPQQNGYPQGNAYPQDGYDQGSNAQSNGYPQGNGYAQDNGYPQDNGYQTVDQAPPPIPQYDQPEAPGDGYLWTPGYWAYGPQGYYWVQGAWVEPPYTGALWTPGWWGYGNDDYFWNAGYWGPTVGYYGGINYGFGYFGVGFYGGYWGGGRFFYNSAYNRLGYGFRGSIYNRPYNGYNGRPGGPAFNSHPPLQYIGRNGGRPALYGGANGNGFRGQSANGNHGYTQQQGFAGNRGEISRSPQVTTYNYGPHGEVGATRYNSPATTPHSFESGQQGYNRGYTAPAQQNYSHSYSAPSQQSYSHSCSAPAQQSAPRSYSAPSGGGGGSHSSAPSGGGGGFHGGGGRR